MQSITMWPLLVSSYQQQLQTVFGASYSANLQQRTVVKSKRPKQVAFVLMDFKIVINLYFVQAQIINMFQKKKYIRSHVSSSNKIAIPEIQSRSKEKIQIDQLHNSFQQYQTDQKHLKNNQINQYAHLREVISQCMHCQGRLAYPITKISHEQGTQTSSKPFLIDLISQRSQELYKNNLKLAQSISQRQQEISERQLELNEIQQKFTTILYQLGNQYSQKKLKNQQLGCFKMSYNHSSEIPSYMKALLMDENQLQLDCQKRKKS